MSRNYERLHILIGDSYIDESELEGKTLAEIVAKLTESENSLRARYGNVDKITLEVSQADFYFNAYRLENDHEYEKRTNNLRKKEAETRERELATLKRLQAKYPNVTIEL